MSVITNVSICLGIFFAGLMFWKYQSSATFFKAVVGIMIFTTLVVICMPESPEYLYTRYRFEKLR